MKKNELMRTLTELVKDTRTGRVHWKVEVSTTEYKNTSEKPKVMEDGKEWTVDECYTSYYCEFRGKEFLLITYEMIHSCEDKKKTTNMVFLPPLGIRVFEIHSLLPYAIETDQMLSYSIHMLWLTILDIYKVHPEWIQIDANERTLELEE